MVIEFIDVFRDEVPGLSQAKEVEFPIDLVPRTMLIFRHHIEWHHFLAHRTQDSVAAAIRARASLDRVFHLGVLWSSSLGRRMVA